LAAVYFNPVVSCHSFSFFTARLGKGKTGKNKERERVKKNRKMKG
jgi:hypothetical protein